jgi:Cd2+/Zn2+-exporting ATPase/Cu+-exporting ATPase
VDGLSQTELLTLVASAERYSEHPLADAVRQSARQQDLTLSEPQDFETLPGRGLRARVDGHAIRIGNRRLIDSRKADGLLRELALGGKTPIMVERDGAFVGVLAAADTLRPEIPDVLGKLRTLGVKHIELLTGDNHPSAAALAEQLGIPYQAELLPEDKIKIVKGYQTQGRTVVMVGDGINDAPALAQADVGIAMGAAGSDVALEAAHLALLRDDWHLVAEALRIAKRTMRVIKLNIGFTAVYNAVGLGLAAFGFLPPILAAAAQSLPDLGILANSARLLRRS